MCFETMAVAGSLLALSGSLISTTHCVCNATVLCSEGPCVMRWPLQVRQSLEPKQRMLCLVHVSPCRSLCHLPCAPAAGSLVGAQGRRLWTGLSWPSAQLGCIWKERRRKRKGHQAREAGWAGAGRESAARLGSRRESERNPVTQRRLQFCWWISTREVQQSNKH